MEDEMLVTAVWDKLVEKGRHIGEPDIELVLQTAASILKTDVRTELPDIDKLRLIAGFRDGVTSIERRAMYMQTSFEEAILRLEGVMAVLEAVDPGDSKDLRQSIDREKKGCNFLIKTFGQIKDLDAYKKLNAGRKRRVRGIK